MPSKNRVKQYAPNAFYHVYNRGVEKRPLFTDARDYEYFTYLLDQYLTPPGRQIINPSDSPKYIRKNYTESVQLAAYCLMPNHIHLLIKQKMSNGITEFMRSLMTSYSMYFNKCHQRVGPLFQGVYKAVTVETDEQLIHVSRYIHLNSEDLGVDYKTYKYSSYASYSGGIVPPWLHPELILELFAGQSYVEFVADGSKAKKVGPFFEKGPTFLAPVDLEEAFREMLE